MWYCFDCEEYFDSPDTDYEYHSELAGEGGVVCEKFCICPMCGGTDIKEATDKCDLCGEYVIETEFVGNTSLCPDCFNELKKSMEIPINNVITWFSVDREKAIELITDYFCEKI